MSGTNQPLSFNIPANSHDKIYFTAPDGASEIVAQSASPVFPTYTTVNVPHTKGKTFFVDAQVSVDGTNWYDAGYEPYYFDSGFMAYYPSFTMTWSVTTTNVVLKLAALQSAYTMYYRLVGYTKD